MTNHFPRTLALAAATAILLAPAAHAAEDFDQAELEAFAEARAEVRDIQEEYAPRLQSAKNDQEVTELRSEAQEKMTGAVDDAGLSVDEFNQIARAAQSDPELNKEIRELSP